MAKMTPKQYDRQHLNNLRAVDRRIDKLFDKVIKELATYGLQLDKPLGDKPFSFKDYPHIQQSIDRLIDSFRKDLSVTIESSIKREDNLSASKAVDLASHYGVAITAHRSKAIAAFAQRKVAGLTLSQRVWNITDTFYTEIENAIDLALRDGTPASRLATELKQYLQHPDKLFRRVRDQHGHLHLSKRAKAYHPGQGIYRSSYKNARRLAVTEINIAYHTADYERWQQLYFVLGYEIKVSGTNPNVCPICAELQGKYPKTFKWVGWHPHCRCSAIAILEKPENFKARTEALLRGDHVPPIGTVKELPDNFQQHLKRNQARLTTSHSLPYFVRNNSRMIDTVLGTEIEDELLREDAKHITTKAREVGKEVQSIAEQTASRYGASCTPINFKSVKSIVRKVKTERNDVPAYSVGELKDTARTTIIANRRDIERIIDSLSNNKKVLSLGYKAVKRQTADRYMGYTGTIVNLRTSTGLIGEIQINTPKMIYAKEPPEIAQALIGKPLWEKIHREVGLEGGLGHKMYEEIRVLRKGSQRYNELKQKSIEYYAHFQD